MAKWRAAPHRIWWWHPPRAWTFATSSVPLDVVVRHPDGQAVGVTLSWCHRSKDVTCLSKHHDKTWCKQVRRGIKQENIAIPYMFTCCTYNMQKVSWWGYVESRFLVQPALRFMSFCSCLPTLSLWVSVPKRRKSPWRIPQCSFCRWSSPCAMLPKLVDLTVMSKSLVGRCNPFLGATTRNGEMNMCICI